MSDRHRPSEGYGDASRWLRACTNILYYFIFGQEIRRPGVYAASLKEEKQVAAAAGGWTSRAMPPSECSWKVIRAYAAAVLSEDKRVDKWHGVSYWETHPRKRRSVARFLRDFTVLPAFIRGRNEPWNPISVAKYSSHTTNDNSYNSYAGGRSRKQNSYKSV